MKELKLNNSDLFTIVSDEDFNELSRYYWVINTSRGKLYVKAKIDCEWVMMHRLILNIHGVKGIFGDHIIRGKLKPVQNDFHEVLGHNACKIIEDNYPWFFNDFGYQI